MADTVRPGRTQGPAHKGALAATIPPLSALPFRLVKGQGTNRPGRDYLEYEDEVEVFTSSVSGALEKAPLEEGRPKETVAVLSVKPVKKRQPRSLYDFQPGYAAVCRLMEMYRALEAENAVLKRAKEELDGMKAAKEQEDRRRGKS